MIVDEPRAVDRGSRGGATSPGPPGSTGHRAVVLVVIGTRPEAIKLAPVILELRRRSELLSPVVCVTAQHRGLTDEALGAFGIVPDHDLEVMRDGQSPTDVAARVLDRLDPVLDARRPDWVIVQGDTSTVSAAALAAFYRRVPVAHVEAGLRSHDMADPFPEEANRRIATLLATLHLAPTETARQNLLGEGVPNHAVVVTGNPGLDALRLVLGSSNSPSEAGKVPGAARSLLVTVHRRESFGRKLEGICHAVRRIAIERDVRIVFPVHPNPAVRIPVGRILGDVPNVRLIGSVPYPELVRLLCQAYLVLTDSGGLQEEGPALGKPVLILRDTTERPESVDADAAIVVGRDPSVIFAEACRLLDDPLRYAAMAIPRPIFGDGHAAPRIIDALVASRVRAIR